MTIAIPNNSQRYTNLKTQLETACVKFSKYFMSLPIIACRISCSKVGYRVHLKLSSGGKEFITERLGSRSVLCINDAVDSILRMMETGGNISLLKGKRVKLKNIKLKCTDV